MLWHPHVVVLFQNSIRSLRGTRLASNLQHFRLANLCGNISIRPGRVGGKPSLYAEDVSSVLFPVGVTEVRGFTALLEPPDPWPLRMPALAGMESIEPKPRHPLRVAGQRSIGPVALTGALSLDRVRKK
jgi:hypothetical protein